MDIGLVAAFAGGTLALLSPCGALLLPAFFASSVGAGRRLVGHATVFYTGLVVTLIPVAIGVGALAATVVDHRSAIVATGAAVIVALGILQIFGRGFDLGRLVPGISRLQEQSTRRTGFLKTLLLGAVSGIAGFCTGPILGAVLTMAATRGPFGAVTLLAVYALGMVLPLAILAATWARFGEVGRSTLRGRQLSIGRVQVHSVHLVTGMILIVVGVGFWTTNGFVDIPDLVSVETQDRLQNAVTSLASPGADVIVIACVAAILIGWWWRRRARPGASSSIAERQARPSDAR